MCQALSDPDKTLNKKDMCILIVQSLVKQILQNDEHEQISIVRAIFKVRKASNENE
jgi:hypothetical protein